MEHNDSNLEPGIDAGHSSDTPAPDEVASPEVAHAHNTETDAGAPAGDTDDSAEGDGAPAGATGPKKRRRGSRGGKNRKKPGQRPSGEGADAECPQEAPTIQ